MLVRTTIREGRLLNRPTLVARLLDEASFRPGSGIGQVMRSVHDTTTRMVAL